MLAALIYAHVHRAFEHTDVILVPSSYITVMRLIDWTNCDTDFMLATYYREHAKCSTDLVELQGVGAGVRQKHTKPTFACHG